MNSTSTYYLPPNSIFPDDNHLISALQGRQRNYSARIFHFVSSTRDATTSLYSYLRGLFQIRTRPICCAWWKLSVWRIYQNIGQMNPSVVRKLSSQRKPRINKVRSIGIDDIYEKELNFLRNIDNLSCSFVTNIHCEQAIYLQEPAPKNPAWRGSGIKSK